MSQPVWLTLDASGPVTRAAIVRGGAVLALAEDAAAEGRPARMASLVATLWHAHPVETLAVIVGPGSFTGLRAALALVRGLSDAGGIPAWGVTVGEAVFAADPAVLCVATAAGPGRIIVERGFPDPSAELRAAMPADGVSGAPTPAGIARAAACRASGEWRPRPLLPLYATPPAAVAREARPAPA